MPEISLTDWVDFVITAGPPQFTKVKELAVRGEYDPRFDFGSRFAKGFRTIIKARQN